MLASRVNTRLLDVVRRVELQTLEPHAKLSLLVPGSHCKLDEDDHLSCTMLS